jgi:hypothetical protein
MNPEQAAKGPSPTAEEQATLRDFAAALRTIRAARGVFLLLLILSLLIHVAAFAAVRWGHVLSTVQTVEKEIQSPEPAVLVGSPDVAETVGEGGFWAETMEIMLPLTEFVGQVSCALLAFCFLASGNIFLAGRLGGVRGSLSAFFWMLVLLALLFPWERWLGGSQVPGVFLTFEELDSLSLDFKDTLHNVLFHVRYVGYPLLALLIALVGDGRYARGYRLVRRHLETRLEARSA